MSKKNQYKQVGWWIPGSLKPGWNTNYQSNFGDMTNKFNQLGLTPLVNGILPNKNLGFYFSMAEFDYIQLLTINPPEGTQNKAEKPLGGLASYSIVAYSIWMASQNWSSFSPIPIMQLQGIKNEKIHEPIHNSKQTYFPTGWYFLGSFSQAWYADLSTNYIKAMNKREALGIHNLSPLYFCQSSFYDCVQMAQAPYDKENVPDVEVIQEYVSWFNEQGFGSLKSIPFMSEDLISEASQIAGKTP
tara:strand:+ start:767 stop:1498 length:732 start_codon:yes stop_codon:yes gene_type:complete